MHFIKRHPLVRTLLGLRGNQRACIYPEPLWGIPYNLYAPFATLFMYALGVNDAQIGIILSIGMVFQVIASLMAGILSDKLGRNNTTVIFDLLSWSVPCLIWALSQNFWWFLVASVFNSMWQITNVSWNCLLVEDCDQKQLVDIYTWATISGLLAVFFAPISSILVSRFDLVPTVRMLYIFSFILMTIKFIIVRLTAKETTQGKIRMEQSKHTPVFKMLLEYKDIFILIAKNPKTVLILFIMVLTSITSMINGSFFPLYVTQNLKLPDYLLAYFPMVRAALMLVFIFVIQKRLERFPFRVVMSIGFVLYIASVAFLLSQKPLTGDVAGLPLQAFSQLIAYIIIETIGYIFVVPRKDSLVVMFVDPQERARITSLIYVIMIGFTSPFGAIIGRISSINRAYPFYISIALYTAMAIAILLPFGHKHNPKEESA